MKSLIGIGTRVKFMTSSDSGIVTDKLGDGMVLVMLDRHDMEIPAFENDLVRATAPPPVSDQSMFGGWDLDALNNQYQQDTNRNNNDFLKLNARSIPNNIGFFLIIETEKKGSGEIDFFDIHLLNATQQDVIFDFELLFGETSEQLETGSLTPASAEQKISRLEWDELNDHPNIRLRLTPIYTEGGGTIIEKTVKIRPQAIAKNGRNFDFWLAELAAFQIIEQFSFQNMSENSVQNLKSYTNQLINLNKKKEEKALRLMDTTPSVQEFANFQRELDLHIEMLMVEHQKLSNIEIINTQLITAQRFIEHAIRVGVEHVFLIHGIGTGRLRDLLAARLRRHPNVRHFKNEYHEKYGWGATQVFLK